MADDNGVIAAYHKARDGLPAVADRNPAIQQQSWGTPRVGPPTPRSQAQGATHIIGVDGAIPIEEFHARQRARAAENRPLKPLALADDKPLPPRANLDADLALAKTGYCRSAAKLVAIEAEIAGAQHALASARQALQCHEAEGAAARETGLSEAIVQWIRDGQPGAKPTAIEPDERWVWKRKSLEADVKAASDALTNLQDQGSAIRAAHDRATQTLNEAARAILVSSAVSLADAYAEAMQRAADLRSQLRLIGNVWFPWRPHTPGASLPLPQKVRAAISRGLADPLPPPARSNRDAEMRQAWKASFEALTRIAETQGDEEPEPPQAA